MTPPEAPGIPRRRSAVGGRCVDTLPSVSAADGRILVRVTSEPLDPATALAWVADPAAGGTCVFVGTVRDHSRAGGVTGLTYEAWEEEAGKRMGEVAAEMLERWPVRRAALLHRFGEL